MTVTQAKGFHDDTRHENTGMVLPCPPDRGTHPMGKIKLAFAFAILIVSLAGVAGQLSGTNIGYLSVLRLKPADATPAPVEPQFGRTPHERQDSVCKNAHTNEYYKGELVSREEVYYWASKYWTGQDLEIAVALTIPEGGRDLFCVGDETKPYYGQATSDGRHYGYSIGLYQWRTIIEHTGKGGCEDWTWQAGHIDRQTECAFQKWNVNKNFRPWTAYTTGKYKQHLH